MDPSYPPFLVGRRFRVGPPEAEAIDDGRISLVVARGAFGSGEHETTASCLELIERLGSLDGAQVLDVGAGTGILAIAALALGARAATLVDNDPLAMEAARQHCALNSVGERVRLVEGELRDVEGTFDLVIANIQGDLLLGLGPELVQRVILGGHLLLSGILWEHNWDVRQLYSRLGCELVRNRFLDEYTTVLLRRAQP